MVRRMVFRLRRTALNESPRGVTKAMPGFQERIMSRWQSFRLLAGWAVVCVASGSMATVVAQTLPI